MKNGYTIFDAHAHVFPNKIAERATSSISVFYDDMPMLHGNQCCTGSGNQSIFVG